MNFKKKAAAATAVCLLTLTSFIPGGMNAGAYTAVSADIPVTCLDLSGKTYSCEIAIEPENSSCPLPDSDILEITSSNSGSFSIEITEPGTFTYTVYEKPGTEPGINYDNKIYKVVVYVENTPEDELAYSVSVHETGSSYKSRKVSFQNEPVTEPTSENTFTETSVTETETAMTVQTTTVVPSDSDDTSGSSSSDKRDNPITDMIDDVLTGDSFPARAVRTTMLTAMLTAVAALLFKRKNKEEEDDDDE